jgi:hypothetical protein
MSESFIDKTKIDSLFNEIVYLSKKTICNDGKSVEIMLSSDRGMILSKEEVDNIVASVSEKKALEADDQVIRNALVYIRINKQDEAYDNLKTLYARAYRKGFEAGKIEGHEKIVEKVVYEPDDNSKWEGDLMGG